jgi:fructose-1,6-bisphosphatase/inositol monophosphatase family enzyme
MENTLNDALLVAWNAARVGAATLLKGYEKSLLNRYLGPPISEHDYEKMAEESIKKIISDAFPDHPILTKGSDNLQNETGPFWYVNSLDGAFNYMRNSPFFSLSIGFI